MELTIGRESSSPQSIGGRLHVVSSSKKEYFIGLEGSVPKTVSRQHCKVIIDPDGNMVLVNLKPTNITFINGVVAVQKSIVKTDMIELGSERFKLELKAILDMISSEIPKTYNISHLKAVWEKYDQAKTEIQVQRDKSAAIQSVTGILSMASIACGFIPSIPIGVRGFLYAIAIVLAVVFFVYRIKHAGEFVHQLKELDEQFHKDYVCPNPQCQRFLGNIPYDDLVKQTKSCFVCKAEYKAN